MLNPLELFMIVGPDKTVLCPFEFYFISKTRPEVRRNVPIYKDYIAKHYFTHQLFEDIVPLKQIYFFDGGVLDYLIHIVKAEKIRDIEDIMMYSEQMEK